MGLVYDFLEFLNQGALPNHPERSETGDALLDKAIEYGRDSLEKTGVGDLILWMLDHGIEFPEKPPEPEANSNSGEHEECLTPYSATRYEWNYEKVTYGDNGYWSRMTQISRYVMVDDPDYPHYGGSAIEVLYHDAKRVWKPLNYRFSVSTVRHRITTWDILPNGSIAVRQQVTGEDLEYGFMFPGTTEIVGIPKGDVSSTSCKHYETFTSIGMACLQIPSFVFSDQTGNESCPLLRPDPLLPDYNFPRIPQWGRVSYFTVGSELFFPVFSGLHNIDPSVAIKVYQSLALEYLEIPTELIQLEPLPRLLFGDVLPPEWYLVAGYPSFLA
jgi:hypothetical protein